METTSLHLLSLTPCYLVQVGNYHQSLSHTQCTQVIPMHVEITTTVTHTYTHMHTNIAFSALKKVREF